MQVLNVLGIYRFISLENTHKSNKNMISVSTFMGRNAIKSCNGTTDKFCSRVVFLLKSMKIKPTIILVYTLESRHQRFIPLRLIPGVVSPILIFFLKILQLLKCVLKCTNLNNFYTLH